MNKRATGTSFRFEKGDKWEERDVQWDMLRVMHHILEFGITRWQDRLDSRE
jgi:hypothetical protein